MKIALIGYGKMGQLIEQLALAKGYSIAGIVDSKNPITSSLSEKALANADVCIDFSTPQSTIDNIKAIAAVKKNVVLGTTGWTEHWQEVKQVVEENKIGFLYSPNFSLGISLFLKIVGQAAAAVAPFPHYDVAGIEIHHNQKIDCPSGTAKAIEDRLSWHVPHPVSFTSVRVGNMPGTHSLIFDSPEDTITLTHTVRNRNGFANGALLAAEWLNGKQGIFTLDDVLDGQN